MPWENADRRCRRCGNVGGPFYRAPSKDGLGRICQTCSRDRNRNDDRNPSPSPSPQGDGTPTMIRCACGHDYRFNIRNRGAVEWLAKKPCPRCRRNPNAPDTSDTPNDAPNDAPNSDQQPNDDAPNDDTPNVEPDAGWVDARMSRLPDELFHRVLPDVVDLLDGGDPVWMQGPPGTAKSTLARQAADALGLTFYMTACWPTMPQSQLFGFRSPTTGDVNRTPFWDAYEYGGLFLLDEIDNGEPSLTAALNAALSNGHCVFAGNVVVERHENFRIIATANTAGLGPESGFIGRLGVDLATRDRFVTVDAQIDDELETALAHLHAGNDTTSLAAGMRAAAKSRLERRSVMAQQVPDVSDVMDRVRRVRTVVSGRFMGVVVSPRTTIHVTNMLKLGFTFGESFAAKLAGLKPSEVESVLTDVGID